MALIKCPECNHSVSNSADYCPKCSTDIQSHLKKLRVIEEAEIRKNAKCPECENKLSWIRYKHYSYYGNESIVYGAYCNNCGYKDGMYRSAEKQPRYYIEIDN